MKSAQSGFTLLEAIVALVLLTTTGMALFGWLNNTLLNLNHLQVSQQRAVLTRDALRFMQTVNPMQRPKGENEFGGYQFAWEAELIEPIRDNLSRLSSLGAYEVGLYQVTVKVSQENQLRAQFNMRQVGYKHVREFSLIEQ